MLATSATATELGWDDVFLECREDMTDAECLSRFYMPVFPLAAAKTLFYGALAAMPGLLSLWIVSFFEAVKELVMSVGQLVFDVLTLSVNADSIVAPLSAGLHVVEVLLVEFLAAGVKYFWGVISALAVLLFILMFRFVLFYLLVSTGYLLWITVLKLDFRLSPANRAIIVGAMMCAGTLYVLTHDWGVFHYWG